MTCKMPSTNIIHVVIVNLTITMAFSKGATFQKKYYIDKEAIEILKKTNTWVLYYQELGPKARQAQKAMFGVT